MHSDAEVHPTSQHDPNADSKPDASIGLPVNPNPYIPPPPVGPRREIAGLRWRDPFRWLVRGARDLRAEPGIGLFYGLCFWAMAWVLGMVFQHLPEYTMSLVSGCLLVGPFLALGLYEASRRRECGEKPDLPSSLTCWDRHMGSMGMLVLVLVVLELLWGRASLVVFAVFFNTGMPTTTGVLQAIFNPENLDFVLVYTAVGGLFATLVFATSVVSIPMILDRDTDAISASITSLQVFLANLPVLVIWGAIISVLVVLAFLPWGAGLVLVGPWLGHSTWHAYRASVHWIDTPA